VFLFSKAPAFKLKNQFLMISKLMFRQQ